jgi:two-component system, OmpR family, response regulator MprA
VTQRILIVEDELEISNYLQRGLAYEGFEVEAVYDGPGALAAARERPPDLVLLDVMLPGLDGMEVARRLRAGSQVPIIMLTARDSVEDSVEGLESGADDYVRKPVAFEELLARIHVQLRRTGIQASAETLQFAHLKINTTSREVYDGERRVNLTAREFDLLELFVRHPQQVLTRDVIYERIWHYNFGSESNVIEVYIRALRQKLEEGGSPRLIQTVRGVGYVLREEP